MNENICRCFQPTILKSVSVFVFLILEYGTLCEQITSVIHMDSIISENYFYFSVFDLFFRDIIFCHINCNLRNSATKRFYG